MTFKHDILPLKDQLFRLALRITTNREEAEDVVQDVLLKLWQIRDSLHKVANIQSFAMRMTYNKALDSNKVKANKSISLREELHDRTDDRSLQPDEQLAHSEQLRRIDKIINNLPEKQRTVIQLRDIEGKSYKDIAEILNITEADVKVTLFRARNALKNKISNTL